MYNEQADTVNVADIVTTESNKLILHNMRINRVGVFKLIKDGDDQLWIRDEIEDHTDYRPEGVSDMRWLGYFVGKNEHIKELYVRDFELPSGVSFMEILEAFIRGVNNNRSITLLDFCGMDLLDGRVFSMLGPFFENNQTLSCIKLDDCDFGIGNDGWRLLALAIGRIKNKSLQKVSLTGCNISDEALVDIITSLSMHPHLNRLDLNGNRLATNGCTTLATLLRCSCTELKHLELDSNNGISDEGIDALVPALKNCYQLHTLGLYDLTSITTSGWKHLATILEAPNSNLTDFFIMGDSIDDEVVNAFTSSLVNNCTLTTLNIDNNASITDNGMKAFSKLLCDTSSVNSTFLSNHTLMKLGEPNMWNSQDSVKPFLMLNRREDKKEVAMIKILQHHNDFDMVPFFEWEFKVLPLMINWFERASSVTMPENYEPNIGPRKLSSIYQFVRGMPLLYVEAQLRKELEDIKAAQKQSEKTIEEEKTRLVSLLERETGIMKRLGQPSK